jgi:oxalate decarboxylase/phosphoglucose isomerase-like protein (cupin superfamily)
MARFELDEQPDGFRLPVGPRLFEGTLQMHPHRREADTQFVGHGLQPVAAKDVERNLRFCIGEGRNNTVEFHQSDVGDVPQSIGHYIENVGKNTLRFLEVFTTPQYADISLASWINNVPRELVAAHLNIDVQTLQKMVQTRTLGVYI